MMSEEEMANISSSPDDTMPRESDVSTNPECLRLWKPAVQRKPEKLNCNTETSPPHNNPSMSELHDDADHHLSKITELCAHTLFNFFALPLFPTAAFPLFLTTAPLPRFMHAPMMMMMMLMMTMTTLSALMWKQNATVVPNIFRHLRQACFTADGGGISQNRMETQFGLHGWLTSPM